MHSKISYMQNIKYSDPGQQLDQLPNNTETETSSTYHLKLDYFFGADLKLQEIRIISGKTSLIFNDDKNIGITGNSPLC